MIFAPPCMMKARNRAVFAVMIMQCVIVQLPSAGLVAAQETRPCAVLCLVSILRSGFPEAVGWYQYYGSGCQYQGSIPCRFARLRSAFHKA